MRRLAVLFVLLASCKREPAHGTATNIVLFREGVGCAELANGRTACWGPGPPAVVAQMPYRVTESTYGGIPSKLPKGISPGALREAVSGDGFSCGLLSNGDVRCWGKNESGELGDGTRNDSDDLAVPVHGIDESMMIAAGDHHACALQKSGLVACWGKNDRHQLSSGTTDPSSRPAPIVGLVGVQQIVARKNGTCARLAEGEVRCWGGNDDGILGDTRKPDHEVPVTVMLPR
ncbi:MAG TPA: hypothetical protein VIF62_06250 [Labilithrix sp.]|jgi:hypothetical protein